MTKILFIGDVVGKPGRKILREVLPEWKEKYQPDVVIVNVENLAHGKGVTPATLAEIDDLGIDCFTGGNHIFNKHQTDECFEKYDKLIRPANFAGALPGHGYYRFSKTLNPHPVPTGRDHLLPSPYVKASGDKEGEGAKIDQQFLVINLNGQVFMDKQFDGTIENPFLALDSILLEQGQKGDIIIVDFHAEATSEKISMGYYADGRISGLFGTHTHVATADARVLPGGTAYATDAGMTGARDGVLGVIKENALKKFLDPSAKFVNEVEEKGVLQINGVLIELESGPPAGAAGKSKVESIQKLYQEM